MTLDDSYQTYNVSIIRVLCSSYSSVMDKKEKIQLLESKVKKIKGIALENMKKTAGIDDILSKLQTDAELVENEGKKFEKTTHKVEERTKRDYRKQICLTITAITATAVIVIIVIIIIITGVVYGILSRQPPATIPRPR